MKRNTKYLLFAVAGLLMATFLLLLIAVISDQTRSVTQPPAVLGLLGDGAGRETFDRSAGSPGGQESTEPARGDSLATKRALTRSLRPFADVEKLPEGLRASAEKLNRAADELVAEMLNTLQREPSRERYVALQDVYWAGYRDLHKQLRAGFGDHEDLQSRIVKNNLAWYTTVHQGLVQTAVQMGEWDLAGAECGRLALHSDGEEASRWWDYFVFYNRKAGPKGRAKIAIATLARPFMARTPTRQDADGFIH